MSNMNLTVDGRSSIANLLKDAELWMAWGNIPNYLPNAVGLNGVASSGGTLNNGSYSYSVSLLDNNGETESINITVSVADANSKVTLSCNENNKAIGYKWYGRLNGIQYLLGTTLVPTFIDTGAAITSLEVPKLVNSTSIEPWLTNPPVANSSSKQLYNEIGRRIISDKRFVIPDVNGKYETTTGKWSEVNYPTNHLRLYTAFDVTDAVNEFIYQFGVYIGGTHAPEHNNFQYLTADKVLTKGKLISVANVPRIQRSLSTRELGEIVITI